MKKREQKEYVIQLKGWKKKYKCHKNKGDHSFMVQYAIEFDIFKALQIFEHYECTACKKQKLKLVDW